MLKSSFNGIIEDIPGVSVDNFSGINLESKIFLLSHCHTDHMHGLDDNFFHKLKSSNLRLYCSQQSKNILVNNAKMGIKDPSVIQVLDIYSVETFNYTFDDQVINVTIECIPSGHCPGSIMFIIEKDNISILFTGDFRYNIYEMKNMKLFKSIDGISKKKFHKVYLDSTFLSENYPKFPSRTESVKEIIKIVKEWFDLDEKNVISIISPANHGQEYIYKKLAIAFNTQIHVRIHFYNTFIQMGLSDYVTNDSNVRIHDCNKKYLKYNNLTCNSAINLSNILTIIPTALIWKNWDQTAISVKNGEKFNTRNVCYSSHSSCEELKAFIEYINCDNIIPFVCPKDSSMMNVYELIDSFKKKIVVDKPFNYHTSPNKKKLYIDNSVKCIYLSSDED